MATGSILLGIALLILVGLFLARPLLQASQREQIRVTQQQTLLAEKEAILDQIRNLDFDHDTGKMPDEIHEHERTRLMDNAAAILQQIDQLKGVPIPADTAEADVDVAIEAAIARVRQGKPQKVRAASSSQSGGFCPNCGQPFDAGDNFCVSCGRNL